MSEPQPDPRARDEITGRYVTKLTDEVQARIVEALAGGVPPEAAASYAGVYRSTFNDWLRKGRDALKAANGDGQTVVETDPFARFAWEVEQAQARFVVGNMASMTAIGRGQLNGRWDALAWQLKVRFPAWFSDRVRHEVTGKDGGPIEHAIVLDPDALERLSIDEMRELEALVGKMSGEVIDQQPLELNP